MSTSTGAIREGCIKEMFKEVYKKGRNIGESSPPGWVVKWWKERQYQARRIREAKNMQYFNAKISFSCKDIILPIKSSVLISKRQRLQHDHKITVMLNKNNSLIICNTQVAFSFPTILIVSFYFCSYQDSSQVLEGSTAGLACLKGHS